MSINADYVFNGLDVARLRKPLVYVLREGETALYVGVSSRGLTRAIDPYHHAIGGLLGQNTRIEIFVCESQSAAESLEREMIEALKPERNVRACNPQGKRRRVIERGIQDTPRGPRAFVRSRGKLHSKCFAPDTDLAIIREWRQSLR